ncbi:hypothetical protein ACFRFS_38060, partial [Streptomyces sp. NPDC056730]
MRLHGERFGVHLSTRRRSLTVGALVLALSAGLASAEAAPPPAPTSGASSSAPSPVQPSAPAPASAAKPAGPEQTSAAVAAAAAPAAGDAVYAYDAAGNRLGSAGEIESSVTTSVTDTSPPTVSITTPGNRAQVLFDAGQGDDITFGFTNATFNSSVTLELYDPKGEKVPGGNGSFNGTAGDWEVENLPLAGTYSLILRPGSSAFGAATVTVSKPVTGTLNLTGPTAQVPLSRAGQDGKLSFTALPGDSLSLGIDAAPVGKSVYARLYGPDGSQVSSRYIAANGAGGIDVEALPRAGTYTLRLDPDAAATGTVGVTASHYADAGTIDPAAPAVELAIDRPGQDGRARFAGVAGQRLSLGVAATGFGSHVRPEIRRPDGSLLEYFLVPDDSSAEWDSPVLPESGTYTIAVLPNLPLATGRLTLTLSRPVALAPLSDTGSALAATIGRYGPNAET